MKRVLGTRSTWKVCSQKVNLKDIGVFRATAALSTRWLPKARVLPKAKDLSLFNDKNVMKPGVTRQDYRIVGSRIFIVEDGV